MPERPRTGARKRAGRCYELAWKSFRKMDDPGDWCLVHGEINALPEDDRYRIGHAWLESESEVFDAVLDELIPRPDYYRSHQPAKLQRFALVEAAKTLLQHDHYGPWTDNVLTR